MIYLAQEFDVHSNQIKLWCDQLLEGATGVFGEARKAGPEPTIEVKALHAKIGDRSLWHHRFVPMAEALENDFLSGARRCAR